MSALVVDCGSGNLRSLGNALRTLGIPFSVAEEPPDGFPETVLLPGVGSFGHASRALETRGWFPFLREAPARGSRLVGICLGMQLLFESSEESPGAPGLGLLPGTVERLDPREGKVPHIGWARLRFPGEAPDAPPLPWAYFVHSFAACPADPSCVAAWASRGGRDFPAEVRRGAVAGVQYHPEKSQAPGLRYLSRLLGGAP